MRKLLASVAICALAAPALALATSAGSQNSGEAVAGGPEHAITLRAKQRKVQLRRERRRAKKERQRREQAASSGPSTASPALQRIAACESGGNPQAIGGGGTFRGKYQFTYATWASVGGSGDPAAAPEAEQDRRAAMLYARSGSGQWPVCGR